MTEGLEEGVILGAKDGVFVGFTDGLLEGNLLGDKEGEALGFALVGKLDGFSVLPVGFDVGDGVGGFILSKQTGLSSRYPLY